MLTLQEIYEKVFDHLLQQCKRSVQGVVGCVYKNEDGLKCAVGCLIADEHYNPQFEGLAISTYQRPLESPKTTLRKQLLQQALLNSGVNTSDEAVMQFLEVVQGAHDNLDMYSSDKEVTKANFKEEARKLAQLFSLNIPERYRS